MKAFGLFGMALLGASMVFGSGFTDDFTRADTDYSPDAALIGSGWNTTGAALTNELWRIEAGELKCDVVGLTGATDATVLYNTSVPLNTNFSYAADVMLKGGFVGIVFNYQDADNYYLARIRSGSSGSFQVVRYINGGISGTYISDDTSEAIAGNQYYTISITSDNDGNFTAELTRQGQSAVLNPTTAFSVSGTLFAGGYAGLYFKNYEASPDAKFDNIIVQTPGRAGDEFWVADSFGRADTVYSPDSSLLGSDWNTTELALTNELWRIQSGSLECDVVGPSEPVVLYNTAVAMNTNCSYSADVMLRGGFVGVVFHYQNATNYYLARIRSGSSGSFQVVRYINGAISGTYINDNTTEAIAGNQYYTISITSDNAGSFTVELTLKGQSAVLNPTTTFSDNQATFTGGYAGLYFVKNTASPDARFDNFNVRVAASALIGFAGWAEGWGVDIGAEDHDYDEDGLPNLYEYGLGGNPTNGFVDGYRPILENNGGLSYTYPQRNDDDSLAYSLSFTDDLVDGVWTTGVYTATGTNDTIGDFDFISNSIPVDENQKFIRLQIEQSE
ncbi:hypothetical protein P4B35_10905 [Pontiellaceae bacterium B12227]|nr:hypothetical protein [Pontiellaceae bacterium B12227]